MKGILLEKENNSWFVTWTDTYSYSRGQIWNTTPLSPKSDSIEFIKDNKITSKPLEEGLEVDFEFEFDGGNPYGFAKLIFKDVIQFKKEDLIRDFKINNGDIIHITQIDMIRNGGTYIIISNGIPKYYIHKDDWTFHTGYPTTEENRIREKSHLVYLNDRLETYKSGIEHDLKQINTILEKTDLKYIPEQV